MARLLGGEWRACARARAAGYKKAHVVCMDIPRIESINAKIIVVVYIWQPLPRTRESWYLLVLGLWLVGELLVAEVALIPVPASVDGRSRG